MKPSLPWDRQVALLIERGLTVDDKAEFLRFLKATNYYRFSGYARYFQRAPHDGDDRFVDGTTSTQIQAIYNADNTLRSILTSSLAAAEILLRTHTAYVIGTRYGPCGSYLDPGFYIDPPDSEPTSQACLHDIQRSRERHILHYTTNGGGSPRFDELPVWSAVEAWSFGTLSRCIERGDRGHLANLVASSLGVAKSGFGYRVRSLVYLRNRCAHHGRLWNHSVVDAGPTPNNARVKAKRIAGQFEPRSILDVVASLDDIVFKGQAADGILPALVEQMRDESLFWDGLTHPKSPRDHMV